MHTNREERVASSSLQSSRPGHRVAVVATQLHTLASPQQPNPTFDAACAPTVVQRASSAARCRRCGR